MDTNYDENKGINWEGLTYAFETYEAAKVKAKKVFDNPPPADERGRWPLPYVGEVERTEKDVEGELAHIGRWVLSNRAALEALRTLIQSDIKEIKTLCESLPDNSGKITAENGRYIIESINGIYGAALAIEEALQESEAS